MFTVQPVDGRRRLTLRSDDAGELLRAFGIVGSVRGGRIAADGVVTGPGLLDGLLLNARIDDFRVVNAPALAQLLSVASFPGLADTMPGAGLRFRSERRRVGKGGVSTVRIRWSP